MPQRDGLARRLDLVDGRGAGAQDLAVGQLRQVALHRVVQLQAAVFHQQQHGAGRQQLGVGEHAKNVILAQRQAGLHVGLAADEAIEHLAPAQQRAEHTRQELAIDLRLQGGVQGLEGAAHGQGLCG